MDEYSGRLVEVMLDLANSYDPYLKEPETLPTPASLDRFLAAHGLPCTSPTAQPDLLKIHQTRQRLREALEAPEMAQTEVILNALLAEQPVKLRLRHGADGKAYFEYDLAARNEVSGVRRLEMESAVGLAVALKEVGKDHLKSCQASPCQDIFMDVSRNHTRRFCSDRCANRYNIAAFRERQHQA